MDPVRELFPSLRVKYTATGEKIPTANGSDPARQLQQYLDRIENYFAEEYVQTPDSLRSVQEAARKASWAAYREMILMLLDRLFAAFSWDPDSYTMFMGIGAILLSNATMLLFRKRRRKS